MDIKKSTIGVIIGRFQLHELHEAHRAMIEYVIQRHEKVLLFLGITDAIGTRKDPLDFLTRKLMIESIYGSDLVIMPLKDQISNELWSEKLDEKIREVFPLGSVLLYGSRDSFIPFYSGKFECIELEPEKYVNATDIRKMCSERVISSPDFRAGVIYGIYNMYPTMYSTIDAAIINYETNEVLLGQKIGETKWRFVGGFVDVADESEEHAVRREVMEETGLEVGDIKFICSQKINDWRYKGMKDKGVMTHFYACKYIFGGPQPSDDICALKWFQLNSVFVDQIIDGHKSLFLKLLESCIG